MRSGGSGEDLLLLVVWFLIFRVGVISIEQADRCQGPKGIEHPRYWMALLKTVTALALWGEPTLAVTVHTDLPLGAKCATVVEVSKHRHGPPCLLVRWKLLCMSIHLGGSMLSCHSSCHASFCLKNCSSVDWSNWLELMWPLGYFKVGQATN